MSTAPVPTDVSVHLPVEGAPVTQNCLGRDFTVDRARWQAYLFEGRLHCYPTVFGENGENRSWLPSETASLPEWVPAAPEWFWGVVADMRAALESPAVEASNARADAHYREHDRTQAATS